MEREGEKSCAEFFYGLGFFQNTNWLCDLMESLEAQCGGTEILLKDFC